ncbi:MAG TPA: hypothetical protein DDZ51_18145 [Planctomycetaceae bacterium]|nr:hypothetical protein [Planctomycetaceae bacterium]
MFRREFLARCSLAAGRPVSEDQLDHCLRSGYVTRPVKSGGRLRFAESNVAEMLDHVARRGRYVSREARSLIEKAASLTRCDSTTVQDSVGAQDVPT